MADQPTQISVDQISVEKGPNLPATPTPSVQAQNEAPLQVAANNAPSPALTATGAAPVVEAETYQVVVKAPEGHGMLAYLVGPGADIILTDIDINNATLAQEGGNLRITLPGGGEILLIDYVNSAHDSHTIVTTAEGNLPAQKLLEAVNLASAEQVKNANVQPAEGPAGHGAEGGFIPPTILGTGVGEGAAVFSQVIGPYALPVWTDSIRTETPVTEKGGAHGVTPPSDLPPFARNDSFSTPENKAITLQPGQLLANDTDPENEPLHIITVQGAQHGTVSMSGGHIVFTPDHNFIGTGSFSYTIEDDHGNTSTADVIIEVTPTNPVNDVIAADDAYNVQNGHDVVMNVLANDSDPQGDSFHISAITRQPAEGTVTVNADGTLTYHSVANNTAPDHFVTFEYEITDSKGATDTATVTVEVLPTANTVDAVDDTGTMRTGATQAFNVTNNDFDPQGDAFHISRIVSVDSGTATFNPADGTITYSALPGNTGYQAHVVYEIIDARGATDTATLTINVNPPAPANTVDAVDDTADLKAGESVRIEVLANDFDAQGDSFSITSHTNPVDSAGNPRGSVVVNGDGSITYIDTPGARNSGVVEFTYTVTDDRGATDSAVVRVTIGTGVNSVDAVDDTATDLAAHPVTINVLANDSDAQGDSFSITSHTNASHGTLVQNANGTFTYTADAGFQGTDTFTYTITDAFGATDTATVTITVGPNSVVAVDDSATDISRQPVTINVLANDFDPQGDSFSITSHTNPAHGTLVQNANGTFTYTADAAFQGVDSFTYTITDQFGATSTATVRIDVANGNTVVAVDDSATDIAAHPVTINVLANDFDPQGDSFSITGHTSPAHGTLVQNANGTFTYTAVAGYQGADSFTYTITDQFGATSTATVNITVGPNNVVAVDDSANDTAGKPVTINVLANDFDPQGDSFSIIGHTNAAHGTVVQNANGTFTYTANANYQGADSFTYTIQDQYGATSTATVRIDVAEQNTVVAVDDSATDTAAHPVVINVLANDSDPQGDSFSITSHTNPAHGTVVQNANGTFTYTAVAGYQGADSFTYTITDSKGATDTATVHITVNPNTVVAVNDDVTMPANVNSILVNAIANDFDPQHDSFSITRIVSVDNGTATIENGEIRYSNPTRDSGVAHITYEITDQFGATDTATVTVHITADTNNVVAVDDSASDTAAHPVVINVLANDSDPQGDSFSITSHTNPAHGTVVQNANGTFTYTAIAGYQGSDSFTYTITDSRGATDTATVNIAVHPNTVVAVDDSYNVSAFSRTALNVLANDFDPQGDSFHIDHIVSGPSRGSVQINANGTVTYRAANTFGAYDTSFKYEIVDKYGATSIATVHIHVNPYIVTGGGNDNGQSGGSGGGGGGDCPLTIDLTGNGIQITPLGQSGAHFDLNGDGIAEHTAWVSGSDDAILALDANHNGTIDGINEVFGGAGVDGYTELARLDANHDGVINAADADFSKLDLWLDANHDGVTQAGELHTLADFGITEISLQTYQTALMYGDAYINDESTVTFADGHTTTSGSVFYTNDANGTITGSNGDDVLIYNNTATAIDGGNGLDVLKVLTASDITVDHNLVRGVEAIDTQNNGADHITINANDVLHMSDTGTIMLTGDAVDHVTITNATQGADVVQNGTTFASYTSSNGGTILVDTAMHVTTDHHQP